MELWIRSTARTNLLKARFLTIMKGEKLYGKYDWEFKGYTICNCNEQGYYELLGTYKTEKRALEVLDEIQEHLDYLNIGNINRVDKKGFRLCTIYEMPNE